MKYWVDLCKRPVFLYLVDVSSRRVWWLFMQRHILEELPNNQRERWRNEKKMTVYVPEHHTLSNWNELDAAMVESHRYMARLHPTAISDAIAAQIAKFRSLDPNFRVSIEATSDGGVNYVLNARGGPVPLSLFFRGTRERSEQLSRDLVERGVAVDLEPEEVVFEGSPIFQSEEFGKPSRLHFAAKSQHDISLVMKASGEERAIELRFAAAHFEGGTAEARFEGELWNRLARIQGTIVAGGARQRLTLSLDLPKWTGLGVSGLPFFNQVSAFIKATLEGRDIEIYLDRFGERIRLGTAPSLRKKSRRS